LEADRGVISTLIDELSSSESADDLGQEMGDLRDLSLEHPEQFSISWTNYDSVYTDAQAYLSDWAATLFDVDAAEEQFWHTFAEYGAGFNLLILKKATNSSLAETFGSAWTDECTTLMSQGRLYVIDMSIFESVSPSEVDGFERFTPASITLLKQDPNTKRLRPILIRVSGEDGERTEFYSPSTSTESTWLYAMLAAKTSISVYGIFLGHLYQWHLVTGALQMTMKDNLSSSHPLYELMEPQSKHLFGFDSALLLLWRHIAPPTSISNSFQFLKLISEFADERSFSADNPKQILAESGIELADFSVNTDWDQFPIVSHYLHIWEASETYVTSIVDEAYSDDQAVVNDFELQDWVSESQKGGEGNVNVSDVKTKSSLVELLASLIYRITIHGVSRMNKTANPAMTFVPNFPPCLQNSTIPEPDAFLDMQTLLSYLPRTGTIGASGRWDDTNPGAPNPLGPRGLPFQLGLGR